MHAGSNPARPFMLDGLMEWLGALYEHPAWGPLMRVGIVVTFPIWIPALLVFIALALCLYMVVYPFYWIATGKALDAHETGTSSYDPYDDYPDDCPGDGSPTEVCPRKGVDPSDRRQDEDGP